MIPARYEAAIRSRLPAGGLVVHVPYGEDSVAKGHGWNGGPIDAVVVDRAVVGKDPGPAIAAWVMHLATQGILAFYGWTPIEVPAMPALRAWRGIDGRLFVPVEYEGVFMAFQVVGVMADF